MMVFLLLHPESASLMMASELAETEVNEARVDEATE